MYLVFRHICWSAWQTHICVFTSQSHAELCLGVFQYIGTFLSFWKAQYQWQAFANKFQSEESFSHLWNEKHWESNLFWSVCLNSKELRQTSVTDSEWACLLWWVMAAPPSLFSNSTCVHWTMNAREQCVLCKVGLHGTLDKAYKITLWTSWQTLKQQGFFFSRVFLRVAYDTPHPPHLPHRPIGNALYSHVILSCSAICSKALCALQESSMQEKRKKSFTN